MLYTEEYSSGSYSEEHLSYCCLRILSPVLMNVLWCEGLVASVVSFQSILMFHIRTLNGLSCADVSLNSIHPSTIFHQGPGLT